VVVGPDTTDTGQGEAWYTAARVRYLPPSPVYAGSRKGLREGGR